MSFPQEYLEITEQALEKINLFLDAVEWKKDKWDTPDIVPIQSDNKVDKEKFNRFKNLVYFLELALFGVDEEGRGRGKLVNSFIVDKSREDTALPLFHVPREKWKHTSLREMVSMKEMAEANADRAQNLVKILDQRIKSMLEAQFKLEDFKARAKNCEDCEGKGYIVLPQEVWREQSRKSDYGSRFWNRSGSGVRGDFGVPFRGVLCDTCQPDGS